MITQARGGSNARAKAELGWKPAYPDWRAGPGRVVGMTEPMHGVPVPLILRAVRRSVALVVVLAASAVLAGCGPGTRPTSHTHAGRRRPGQPGDGDPARRETGRHGEIPAIAEAFPGVTPTPPSEWPDDRFDVVWTFTRTADGWHFAQLPELALPEDNAATIDN